MKCAIEHLAHSRHTCPYVHLLLLLLLSLIADLEMQAGETKMLSFLSAKRYLGRREAKPVSTQHRNLQLVKHQFGQLLECLVNKDSND